MLRKIVVFLVYIFNLVVFRVEKNGEENIKEKGAYLICANHRSNWDAPILVSNLKRKVYVMAKAELFKNKFIKWFGRKCCVFPVKRGMRDIESIKYSLNLLKDGEILVIFPEGTRNGIEKGEKVKDGAAFFAVRTGAKVIPVGISGGEKPFKQMTIRYGKPMDFSDRDKNDKEELDKITEEIMEEIIKLSKEK